MIFSHLSHLVEEAAWRRQSAIQRSQVSTLFSRFWGLEIEGKNNGTIVAGCPNHEKVAIPSCYSTVYKTTQKGHLS